LLEYVAVSRANSEEKLPQLRLLRVQQLNGGIFISIRSRSSMLLVINHAAGCQPQTHNKQQNCSVINEQFGKWKSQPHTHTYTTHDVPSKLSLRNRFSRKMSITNYSPLLKTGKKTLVEGMMHVWEEGWLRLL
jgi:hypothetical protein